MLFFVILNCMEHYLLEAETYEIIGCCMEVHSQLGVGFSEIVYKDALEHEFKRNHIPFAREVRYKVKYKDIILPHEFVADFVVFDSVILELKAVTDLSNEHFEQTLNYLAVSRMEVGLLINFRKPKLQYKRLILTQQ